jgi:hypothetical protein
MAGVAMLYRHLERALQRSAAFSCLEPRPPKEERYRLESLTSDVGSEPDEHYGNPGENRCADFGGRARARF